MDPNSKDEIKSMIAKNILDIYNHGNEIKKSINDDLESVLEYFQSIIAQISQTASGPLIPKTPKVTKKKGLAYIEPIPEDDVAVIDSSEVEFTIGTVTTVKKQIEESTVGRSRREASIKAATNIKRQQSITLSTKMRRPSDDPPKLEVKYKKKYEGRAKRKKTRGSSSEEECNQGPSKHSKTEEGATVTTVTVEESRGVHLADETFVLGKQKKSPMERKHSTRKTSDDGQKQNQQKSNIADDTVIAPTRDDVEEPSIYEDATSKPTPIMNSTMNLNSIDSLHRMMNATVVLEPLAMKKLDETVTIQKKLSQERGIKNVSAQKRKASSNGTAVKSLQDPNVTSPSSKPLQDRMRQLETAIANKEFDELLTDDESSPEVKKPRRNNRKQDEKKKRRQKPQDDVLSEDEVLDTPPKSSRGVKTSKVVQEIRNGYKSNALFSPYAKESVKKRVEAFEQAGMHSPKSTADVDIPTRVTRTKTRAIAAARAEGSENAVDKEKTIARKLVRKSLAKAKRISLAKQAKEAEDCKENFHASVYKERKVIPNEKINQKHQQKTTPLTKSKTQLPVSVNRLQQTPSNSQYPSNYGKALSATRSNIVTGMDSFLQAPRTATKPNLADKLDEKKQKLSEDDARKKREEALRLQTEEKRRKRQEKEIKIKLAREAKEKLEQEKREKAEREREEKARLAQQIQEKQREEMERKRILQQQRAQIKEERRKLEEQQRLLRLQEQEEAQRVLAEQKRREMESEKRKEAEARAQQHAAAEALKLRQQVLAAQSKHMQAKQMTKQIQANNKYHGPTNYILDSEPDDDDSDDESTPKHVIPYWAQPHIRRGQLQMQRYIPMSAVNKFFDAKKSTPDLADFFHGIDKSKLKRTSSAIWKTPPRYSMME